RPDGVPPIGRVAPAPERRLRIGLVEHSPAGGPTDPATVAAVREAADRLAALGHEVVETPAPVPASFREDFIAYWGLLALSTSASGRSLFDPDFDPGLLDPFTAGLARMAKRRLHTLPLHLFRLERARRTFNRRFGKFDVYLNPVVSRETPQVGYLDADLPFETHLERVVDWVSSTPPQHVAGSPAASLPTGMSPDGPPWRGSPPARARLRVRGGPSVRPDLGVATPPRQPSRSWVMRGPTLRVSTTSVRVRSTPGVEMIALKTSSRCAWSRATTRQTMSNSPATLITSRTSRTPARPAHVSSSFACAIWIWTNAASGYPSAAASRVGAHEESTPRASSLSRRACAVPRA